MDGTTPTAEAEVRAVTETAAVTAAEMAEVVADGMIPLMSRTETETSGCNVMTRADELKSRSTARKKTLVWLA